MKKFTKVATLVALPLMMAASLSAQVAESQEDVKYPASQGNPAHLDFEVTHTANCLAKGSWATGTVLYKRTEERFYTGAASMRLPIPAESVIPTHQINIGDGTSPALNFDIDKQYKASVWVYIDGAKCEKLTSISLGMFAAAESASNVAINIADIEKDKWVRLETPIFTGAGEKDKLIFKVNTDIAIASEALMYIDNVQFYDINAQDGSVAPDDKPALPTTDDSKEVAFPAAIGDADRCSFEVAGATELAASGWFENTKEYMTRTDEQAYDGTYSMKINVADSVVNIAPQMQSDDKAEQANFPTYLAGKNYKVSCWIYIDADEAKNSRAYEFEIGPLGKTTRVDVSRRMRGGWIRVESDAFSFAEDTSVKTILKAHLNDLAGKDEFVMYMDKVQYYDVDAQDGSSSAINDATESTLKVASNNGRIYVNGVAEGTVVEVYNLSGAKVASTVATADLSLEMESGLYLVKVGNQVRKVVL